MMKKVFVYVSIQNDPELTVRFARACCSYARDRGLIPIASQYLFHDDSRNNFQISDLKNNQDLLIDLQICRELMTLCDMVWVFMDGEPDDMMLMVLN